MAGNEDNSEGRRTPLSDGQKEQIKLTATYLNGIAIGLFLIGSLSIPVAILLTEADLPAKLAGGALALFSFCISPYIHLRAKRSLERLDR